MDDEEADGCPSLAASGGGTGTPADDRGGAGGDIVMNALKQGVRSQLIAAGVNGGTAIFDTLAPSGQAYLYIVFQYIGGGDENRTRLDTLNELWQVKVITDQHQQAGELAEAIRAALHQQPLMLTGWQHLSTNHEKPVWLVEMVGRTPIYHAGGTFRMRVHMSG